MPKTVWVYFEPVGPPIYIISLDKPGRRGVLDKEPVETSITDSLYGKVIEVLHRYRLQRRAVGVRRFPGSDMILVYGPKNATRHFSAEEVCELVRTAGQREVVGVSDSLRNALLAH